MRSRILWWTAALAVLASCRPAPEPSGLPAERLDPVAALRSAGPAGSTDGEAAESGRSSFEERLRHRRGGAAAPRQPVAAETVALQTIPLGGGLVADLPQRLGAWSWSREGHFVLAVHEDGGRADALIYAQVQPVTPQGGPAAATNRFLHAVEPQLASDWLLLASDVAPQAAKLAARLSLGPREAARAFQALASPTLGRGLGYRSDPGSFTGWRWMGENEHGVYLRLARSEGVWGVQGEVPEAVQLLVEELESQWPELQEALWAVSEPAPSVEETPAWLVLGSAARGGRGIDLALLCRRSPECAVEADMAELLATLRPGPPGSRAPSPADGAAALAGRAGIQLLDVDLVPALEAAGSANR